MIFITVNRDIDTQIIQPFIITLRILGDNTFKKTIFTLKKSKDFKFILIDKPILPYKPVLKCLQERVDLPLTEELLALNPKKKIHESRLIPSAKGCGCSGWLRYGGP